MLRLAKNEYDCQSIDADLFVDEDGQPYLLWGQGKCWIAPLEEDMVTFKAEPLVTPPWPNTAGIGFFVTTGSLIRSERCFAKPVSARFNL